MTQPKSPLPIPVPKTPAEQEYAEKQACLASPGYYARKKLRGPPQAPYNGKFVISRHHLLWSEAVVKYKHAFFEAFRGSGKSYMFTLALPLWAAEKYPGRQILIVSGSKDQVATLFDLLRTELDSNPNLAHLIPKGKAKNKWSADGVKLTNGSTIVVTSLNSNARGKHPVLMVFDDMINDDVRESPSTKEKAIKRFTRTFIPMAVPDTRIVVVGTPMVNGDTYDFIRAQEKKNPGSWFTMSLPCYVKTDDSKGFKKDEEGNYISSWPEARPVSFFESIRATQGEFAFGQEYLLQVVSEGAAFFTPKLVDAAICRLEDCVLGETRNDWVVRGVENFYIGVDYAVSAEAGSDYTVVFVMGTDREGLIYVVDISIMLGASILEQTAEQSRLVYKYRPERIRSEAVGAQRLFGDELQRVVPYKVELFFTSKKKHSLSEGIPTTRLPFEQERIRYPYGDDRTRTIINEWLDQLKGITVNSDGQCVSTTEHDDLQMSFYLCYRGIVDGSGFQVSFLGVSSKILPGTVKDSPGGIAQGEQRLVAVGQDFVPEDVYIAKVQAAARYFGVSKALGFEKEDAEKMGPVVEEETGQVIPEDQWARPRSKYEPRESDFNMLANPLIPAGTRGTMEGVMRKIRGR